MIASQSPHLQIPQGWGLIRFQHMTFGVTQNIHCIPEIIQRGSFLKFIMESLTLKPSHLFPNILLLSESQYCLKAEGWSRVVFKLECALESLGGP